MKRTGESEGDHLQNYSTIYVLLVIMSIFVIVTVVLSYLRFMSFLTLNWDLGIPMQAFWSTSHGYILYETADYTFFGVNSFLEVHSTYIALLFSKLYLYFSTPMFFFILQSIVLASAIFPLYLISRKLLTKTNVLIVAILFLTNFLFLSATFWDFHWEAFIPMEFLWMFYFIQNRRYLLALVPFFVGVSTIEVFPFLSMGLILYFLYDRYGVSLFNIPKFLKKPDYFSLFVFFILSLMAYFLVRTVQYVIIPHYLGTPTSPSSLTLSVTSLFFLKLRLSLGYTAIYWLMLYASFGFIPLLYPKHFIIGLPWLFFTIFLGNNYASSFGFQYSYIAIPPVLLGAVFGLSVLEHRENDKPSRSKFILIFALAILAFAFYFSRSVISLNYPFDIVLIVLISSLFYLTCIHKRISSNTARQDSRYKIRSPLVKGKLSRSATILVLSLIVLNLIIGPLNPINFGASTSPGYEVSYSVNPEYPYMSSVTAFIPSNATIVTSDNLFNFVANDVNAYSLTWFSPTQYNQTVPYFPFNAYNLPKYVLVDSSQFSLVPGFLSAALFNSSSYGLITYIYSEHGYPGTIYLFELGYSQSAIAIGNVSFPVKQYISPQNVNVGSGGLRELSTNSRFGEVISSNGISFNQSKVSLWYGPYNTYLPGNYTVTVNVSFSTPSSITRNSTNSLFLDWTCFNKLSVFSTTVNDSKLTYNKWVNLTYQVHIAKLYPEQEIRGFELFDNGTLNSTVTMNYISLSYLR